MAKMEIVSDETVPVQSMSEMITTIESDGTVLFATPTVEHIFGFECGEMVGQNVLDLLPSESLRQNSVGLKRLGRGKLSTARVELNVPAKIGGNLTISVFMQRYMLLDRVLFITVVRRMSVEGNASPARRHCEDYIDLLRLSTDSILVIEPGTEIVLDLNDPACEEYGFTRREFIGRCLKDLTEDVGRGERLMDELVTTGSCRAYESVHFRADGTPIDFLINASLVAYRGRPAILTTNRDITEQKNVQDALQKNLSLLSSTFDASADGILAVDLENKIVATNEKFFDLWNVPSRLRDTSVSTAQVFAHVLAMVKDRERYRKVMDHSVRNPNEISTDEFELINGRVFQRYSHPQKLNGKTVGRVMSFRDVTKQRRTEQDLGRSEARLRTLLESMSEGLLQVDGRDRIVYMNNRICEMTGYSQDELIGKDWSSLLDEKGSDFVNAINERRKDGLSDQYEISIRTKSGDALWVMVGGAPVYDAQGNVSGSMGVFTDISDRKESEKRLLHDAMHDGLTGLANRSLFMEHLRVMLKRSRNRKAVPFALLYLDYDRFKVINDSLGHAEGDKLLKYIARRLESCVRPGDLIARLGGDEFVILLSEITDTAEALLVAERIQNDLKVAFDLGGREIYTTASIGITLSTSGYQSADDMLRDADIAMYYAKSRGKAQYQIFDQAMHKNASRKLQIETEMRGALQRREFEVLYQPILRLDSGGLIGFEALLRWMHPKRGIISPEEFIPLAEENGLIVKLGEMVIENSCKQLRSWQTILPGAESLTMSVNLSSKEFLQLDLVERISGHLRESGLDPRFLKLEITESHIMENSETAGSVMHRMRDLGIEMCLDDFGTGYSSLSYLHRLPVSCLKIDRTFIGRMTQTDENREIVETIVRLGQNLKMQVVAEGIETMQQFTELTEMGCEFGQGYLFASPLSNDLARQFIEEHTTSTAIELVTPSSDPVPMLV
jgi:diguanylate cyclase (GGDEF)-like protein/PAS domain S-box-containing protein